MRIRDLSLLVFILAVGCSNQPRPPHHLEALKTREALECPRADSEANLWEQVSEKPFNEWLEFESVKKISKGIPENHQLSFGFEYLRFPYSLRKTVRKAGGTIHLIHGRGVSDDPTWGAGRTTADGRSWAEVPGSGGNPLLGVPTRVVVNRLYDGHGSINLVLHEHAHTLDAIAPRLFSQSNEWQLIVYERKNLDAIEWVCGSYCSENINEAFAEAFAIYHGCAESRKWAEENMPTVADYMARLTREAPKKLQAHKAAVAAHVHH